MREEMIPLIDLTPSGAGDPAGVRAAVDAVAEAAGQVGCFRVVGHGVPAGVLANATQEVEAFFGLPEAEKRRYLAVTGLGYVPRPDRTDGATVSQISPSEALVVSRVPDAGPWPARPPGLRPALVSYMEAMESLAGRLLRLCAEGLGRPADAFDQEVRDSVSFMRVAKYFHQDPDRPLAEYRATPHRDDSSLSILWSDREPGGLQATARDGEWADVDVVPGSLVVLVGRLLESWSGGRLPANLHRVINPLPHQRDANTRLSYAYFHSPRSIAEKVRSYLHSRGLYTQFVARAQHSYDGAPIQWDTDLIRVDQVEDILDRLDRTGPGQG
jgi:isopenicillin N synthase-like dioxygenase